MELKDDLRFWFPTLRLLADFASNRVQKVSERVKIDWETC